MKSTARRFANSIEGEMNPKTEVSRREAPPADKCGSTLHGRLVSRRIWEMPQIEDELRTFDKRDNTRIECGV